MDAEKAFNYDAIANQIVRTYEDDSGINFIDIKNLPVRDQIIHLLETIMEILFPGYTGKRAVTKDTVFSVVHELLLVARRDLADQIERALRHRCRLKECPTCDCPRMASRCSDQLLTRLPEIRSMLKGDVMAAYDGDPAAKSFEEVVISYPYIVAIATYRVAHELYKMEIPLIPRIMSEWAHSRTGIDIHPGAKIGKNFFIDHGTGVVIGETAVIGDNVKMYQGVTLGAVSFPRDEKGNLIKGVKRHPTVGNNVIIYSNASILGEKAIIGDNSVIGGNVWITTKIPEGTIITLKPPKHKVTQKTTQEK